MRRAGRPLLGRHPRLRPGRGRQLERGPSLRGGARPVSSAWVPMSPRRRAASRHCGSSVPTCVNPLVLILLVASVGLGRLRTGRELAHHRLHAAPERSAELQSELPVAGGGAAAARTGRAARHRGARRPGAARSRSREVVPGDVVRLAAGDLVPGDGRLAVEQGPLPERGGADRRIASRARSTPTRRSRPARPVAEAATAVLQGTSVVSGLGEAVIVRTGARTEFGQVAARLAGRAPQTEFERGTRQFGMLILPRGGAPGLLRLPRSTRCCGATRSNPSSSRWRSASG